MPVHMFISLVHASWCPESMAEGVVFIVPSIDVVSAMIGGKNDLNLTRPNWEGNPFIHREN